ncbi:class E sortase [Streptomyces yanii]|uniref:class E sortase n=1 Tax=Streptomyces yanii TaxID=78510 RepID=UPI0031EE7757
MYVLFWTGVKARRCHRGGRSHPAEPVGAWCSVRTRAERGRHVGALDLAVVRTHADVRTHVIARPRHVPRGEAVRDAVHPPLRQELGVACPGDTEVGTLKKGLGHYRGTAPLGGVGNFAVAGHRRTYGDPFKDFPTLRRGDAVVLTDGTTWFTYRIEKKPYRTVPSDTGVIDAVPRRSGFDGPGRYLTLTTCDPEWGSSHRLIAWAHLDATQPVTDGKPAAFHS